MKIGGVDGFPDSCMRDCPEHDKPFYQGNLCSKCPLFNCIPAPDDPEKFVLLEPEEYRKDWAKEWKKWFDEGMSGVPDLRF